MKSPNQQEERWRSFFSLGVVLAIFLTWLVFLPENLSPVESEAPAQSSSSPFELVKSGASSVYRDWNGIVDNAKNVWPF